MGAREDEAAIRAMAERWSRALEAKDVDGLTADYADDFLLYDLKAPAMRGVAALRRLWAACLPHFPAKFKSEHRDFAVTVGGDVAFAHGMHHIVPLGEASGAGETPMRITLGYRKMSGAWKVVHEHVSVPLEIGR